MWDREKVKAVAEAWGQRRSSLGPAAGAALAYARWQGMTDEPGIDREAAKKDLDAQMDALGEDGPQPEQIRQMMGHVADDVLAGLMKYTLRRSVENLKDDGRRLEASLARDAGGMPPTKQRKRDREK